MRAVLLVTAVALACLSPLVGTAGASGAATVALRLDGVPFRPEIADTSAERSRGLMHRKRAPKDGMLFVFPMRTTGGFWMKNTLVPLRIVFFDAAGKRVRQLSMPPCHEDPCPVYDPGRAYRFALELPVSDERRALRIGPPDALARLVRAAS